MKFTSDLLSKRTRSFGVDRSQSSNDQSFSKDRSYLVFIVWNYGTALMEGRPEPAPNGPPSPCSEWFGVSML